MNTHTKIRTLVYRILAQREAPSSKIEQKLLTKGFLPEDISSVLEALRQEGIVSDKRFTESYIRYRQNRGYGPLRIRQELQSQGLAKEMIEDQLDIADNAWFAEASRVWQKRFRGKLPVDLKERGKQFRFLQYRGFTQEQIEQIFDL
jgi:regulatory protein